MREGFTHGASTCDATSIDATEQKEVISSMNATSNEASKNVNDAIALNGRSALVGLRRQPTIYPHGLSVSVHTITSDIEDYRSYTNYSRASTLRSESWAGGTQPREQNSHRKYRINMINNPENLAELQVRRYKYPLTGNYYLDPQDQMAKVPWVLEYFDHMKRYCRWKHIRWPIIFLASVLLFFGIITYCIWLHDVSIARQRYLQQRRFQFNLEHMSTSREGSQEIEATLGSVGVSSVDSKPATTERISKMKESTLLRAIDGGTRSRQRPLEQKLTTLDYRVSKGFIESEKNQFNQGKKTTSAAESITDGVSVEEQEDYEAIQRIRFTSGHQNNFGVPIEEDERILRLIDSLNPLNQPQTTSVTPQTKVSPTIPPVLRVTPTIAMDAGMRQTLPIQENGCYSTTLPMCRGVLEYDLTYNSTAQLSQLEQAAYENLIYSNCSGRAIEFICALLEPECRPSHIGILPPCRRICKGIVEACSIVIENSDVLSSTFDCNLYPDSSDAHVCEDPTRRRDYCYNNEFECYDGSCIPQQWQCDNIKDCATGEDEDECLQCDHQDEFRCRSNDKCVPETVRCDLKYDCFDGSDEDDCEEYGSGDESAAAFDEAALNSFPRVFSYASYLSPNQTNADGLYAYISATTDEDTGTKFEVHEVTNRTSGVSKEDVTNNVPGTEGGPKGFVNFRDSKEIMMTSDSENKFKYSAVRGNRTGSRYSTPATLSTTPALQTTSSRLVARTTRRPADKVPVNCAPHQLRCVSGKCITVAQLCDKKIDCPDGADELMCVYKAERSTTKRYSGTSGNKTDIDVATTTDSIRTERRTIRTTLKRKTKA